MPPFLPDHPVVRRNLLDYAFEVQRFDQDCSRMLALLEKSGELDNTLVIITSDNGMAFPRAKANCYEYGIHIPLAICWKSSISGNRELTDMVDFTHLTAMIYDATGAEPPSDFPPMGASLLEELASTRDGQANPDRTEAFVGHERDSTRSGILSAPSAQPNICTSSTSSRNVGRRELRENTTTPHGVRTAALQALRAQITVDTTTSTPARHSISSSQTETTRNTVGYFAPPVAKRPEEELFAVREDPRTSSQPGNREGISGGQGQSAPATAGPPESHR